MVSFEAPEKFEKTSMIWIHVNDDPIGTAKLSRDGSVAILADINIYSGTREISPWLPFIKVNRSYKGKGYGTLLLKQTIEYCKENNIKQIKGIVKGDMSILLPWYRKHGFSVNSKNELLLNLDI